VTGDSRRFLLSLATAGLLLAGCGQARHASTERVRAVAGKPGVPVDATLEMVGTTSVGAPTRFRLTVRPGMDCPETSVRITLPEGAKLTEGSLSWKGALRANETRKLDFVAAVPETARYTVYADVSIVERKGATLRRRAALEVGLAKGTAPASVKKPSHKHKAVRLEDFLKSR
jgi:hypothetical protein